MTFMMRPRVAGPTGTVMLRPATSARTPSSTATEATPGVPRTACTVAAGNGASADKVKSIGWLVSISTSIAARELASPVSIAVVRVTPISSEAVVVAVRDGDAGTVNAPARDKVQDFGDGNDKLDGGANNDQLYGEGGDDTLTGGAGADRFDGGANNDRATDFNASQGDTQVSIP